MALILVILPQAHPHICMASTRHLIYVLLPLLPLLAVAGGGGGCRAGDASSLLAFKHALSDPDGHLVSWSAAVDCCSWSHVSCDATGVARLRLAGLNLSWSDKDVLAPLAGLTNLVSLDLSNNNFRYLLIPAGIFHHIPRLTHLNLSMSGFYGSIPADLGKARMLVSLDLSSNFRLTVEDGRLLADLPELEELYLDEVDLSTTFPGKSCRALSSWLPKLRAVSLNGCSIVNCSLDTLLSNLTSITHLDLGWNDFSSSPVPSFLSDFRYLSFLSLAFCHLVGEFPVGVFQLKRLRILDVFYNPGLSGKLSEFPKGSALEELVLSDTNFAGELPASLGNLASLTKLDLSYARFSGELPAEIGKLVGLTYLDLSGNKFVGRIPSLAQLKDLVHLDLSSNGFQTGSIPASLCLGNCSLEGEFLAGIFQLKRLRILDVSGNPSLYGKLSEFPKGSALEELVLSLTNFAGELPGSLGNLASLAKLDLSYSRFSGELPAEIGKLVGLTYLDLSSNNFVGRIPSLAQLKRLVHLDLSNNNFVGRIPSLAQLKHLVHLDLSSNGFQTGSIPASLCLGNCSLVGEFPAGIFQLKRLRILDFSNNPCLSGKLLEFPKSSALEELVLSHTNLTCGLLVSVGNLAQLTKLDLSNTRLSGELPVDIGKMVRLTHLDLSNNNFVGRIPSLVELKRLVTLDLSSNSFQGFIYGVADSLPRIEYLNMGNNSLSGYIPKSLFSLPSLRNLELYMNNFSGELHEFDVIGNNSVLSIIDLSDNRIQGEFPRSIFQLSQLETLKLSSNNFSGIVQLDLFGGMPYLSTLELSHSGFSVHIENDSHFNFPQFYTLKLASCNLTRIPELLQNQSWLYDLDLSNNRISGDIPRWMWKLELSSLNLSSNRLTSLNLQHVLSSRFLLVLDLHSNQLQGTLIPLTSMWALFLDLSGNRFHSTISLDIGTNLYSSFVSLSGNNLIGSIPSSFCKVYMGVLLDLSENNLNGSIPSCLPQKMIDLEVLNLRENSLSGAIPDAFSKGCSLMTLDLYGNKIVGQIPTSLKNCRRLVVLNLGSNSIEGTFPSWLGEMPHLRILVLRSNRLRGRVEPFLGGFQQLQIMDLSSNSFSGNLCSSCFNSWRSMIAGESKPSHDQVIEFRISINGTVASHYRESLTLTIKGSELKLEKILTALVAIDLSNNNFEGFIPETIGNLRLLHLLNLSNNAFVNTIPRSIGNLPQLESLDLSCNKLTGNIPQEIVHLTFLTILNLSFNRLVGEIPRGQQLDTFAASSYRDNAGLCGPPLSNSCEVHPTDYTSSSKSHNLNQWTWIAAEIGFIFGFGIIWLPIVFCRRWWVLYFTYVDSFLWRIPFADQLLLS